MENGEIFKLPKSWIISSRVIIAVILSANRLKNLSLWKKKRICNITYRVPDFPLDFRFSVSQETNLGDVEPMDDCDFTREKKRISRQYKNWQFDTTQVEGDINMDADDESTVHYEVELEVNDATKLNKDVHWEAHSGILKIMDMLKMCN